MEQRLTHKDSEGWYIDDQSIHYDMRRRGEEINRLAAHEDTGLEPEDFKKVFNEDAILKLAAQCLETTPDRLRELVQAERGWAAGGAAVQGGG